MRWSTPLAVALGLALTLAASACRQTIVLDSTDGGGGAGGGGLGGGFGGFGGGFGGFGGTFDGGQPDCTGQPLNLTAELPDVMVVLDRSTGMSDERLGSSTALSAARDAVEYYASKYQAVRFGYVEFPGSGQSCNSQIGCCASTPSLPSTNFQAFDVALHACDQGTPYCVMSDQRPTTAALASAASSFSRNGNTHIVLLITNGQPDCGSTGQNTPCMDATMIVNQLNQVSVNTNVVVPTAGPLDAATGSCLSNLALQGGAATSMSPFFHQVTTPAELTDMIGQITHTVAKTACHLAVQTSTPMQIRADSILTYMGKQVTPDLWDVSGNGYTIDVNGTLCENLIMGNPQKDFLLLTGCDSRPH